VKAREERGAVERAGDLAGSAAEPVDELALGNHWSDAVAMGFVARANGLVEVEDLPRHDDDTIELRCGEAEVVGPLLGLAAWPVPGLEVAEPLVELDVSKL